MKPPVDNIRAPLFPRDGVWINSEPLRIDELRGEPVLIEFWDFCRPNSLRTLPYLAAWDERYAASGLHVVAVHCSGFRPSAGEDAVREAVTRLQVPYPVMIDTSFALWHDYENGGWPARYLWNAEGMLADYHYGEGAYVDTELTIQELLGVEREPLEPLHPEDASEVLLAPCSEERTQEPWSGPYEAGTVWAVLSGHGNVTVNGTQLQVDHPGAYAVIEHEHHTEGVLELELGAGVRCWGVCFTPGIVN